MPSTVTDRLYGESSGVAVKAPCLAVTAQNNALSGLGAFNVPNGGSYTPNDGDRILVAAQTDPTQNGIYNASATAWQRAGDFDGAYDVVEGTLVVVLQGATGIFYQLTTADPVIGTSALTFQQVWQPPNVTYPQTASEQAAGVAPVNTAYQPGNVFRYCTATQIGNIQGNVVQDVSGPIQNAINSTTGDVFFPTGFYYIGKPLYITAASVQNLRFVGESRTNTYIQPNAANIADGNGINALIINQAANAKFQLRHIRLSSQVAAYTGICISAVHNGPAAQQAIFSGGIDDCWFDTGSTNSGFFNGFLSNFTVTNSTWEFQKGVFNFPAVGGGASNVQFSNCTLSNCYDYFLQSANTSNNEVSVHSLQAYTHNRGVLFNLNGDTSFVLEDIQLQSSTGGANLGGIGIGSFLNCTDLQLSHLSVVTNALSTGATATQLTFQGCSGQVSDSIFDGCDTGILLTGTASNRLSFDHVDIQNTLTAAFRVQTGTPSGILEVSNCNWSNSNVDLILFSNAGGFDFYLRNCTLLNAGLTAGAGARNMIVSTSGVARLTGCAFGQNNGAAAAGYYIEGDGTGTLEVVDPKIIGNPPTGLTIGTQTVIWDGVDSSMPGMPQLLPNVGGSATYTVQQGTWSLKNKVCHFQGALTINAIGTGSQYVISGLPFTSAAGNYGGGAGSINYFTGLALAVVSMGLFIDVNTATARIRGLTAAGTANANQNVLTSGTAINFAGSYRVYP